MNYLPLPTQQELHKLLSYDPQTGALLRRKNNKAAGTKTSYGYQMALCGKLVLNHRVIWKYVTGADPTNVIDHCDGNPLNNVFSNLREATRLQNIHNSRTNNPSKVRGVYLTKNNRWTVQFQRDGVKVRLGTFSIFAEARKVAVEYDKQRSGAFFTLRTKS